MDNAGQLQNIKSKEGRVDDTPSIPTKPEPDRDDEARARFDAAAHQRARPIARHAHDLEPFAHVLRVGGGNFNSARLLWLPTIDAALIVAAFRRHDVRC
jgi:hypothetical protein